MSDELNETNELDSAKNINGNSPSKIIGWVGVAIGGAISSYGLLIIANALSLGQNPYNVIAYLVSFLILLVGLPILFAGITFLFLSRKTRSRIVRTVGIIIISVMILILLLLFLHFTDTVDVIWLLGLLFSGKII